MINNILELEAGERILTITRRHWLMLWLRIFSIGIFSLFPIIAWIIILISAGISSTLPYDIGSFTPHVLVLYGNWLLFMLIALGQTLLNHHLDVWIITNHRIISIDQHGFFNRSIGSFRLDRLQDINIEIHGFLATILNYGSVEIETASEGPGEFRAYNIPHPESLKTIIMEAAHNIPTHP